MSRWVKLTVEYDSASTENEAGSVERTPSRVLYPEGEQVLLTASPKVGYNFIGWEGDVESTDTVISILMNANKTVTAVFEKIGFQVGVEIYPSDVGIVTVTPEKESYDLGDEVSIEAEVKVGYENYEFNAWEGITPVPETNPFRHVISGSINLKAIFSRVKEEVETQTIISSPTVGVDVEDVGYASLRSEMATGMRDVSNLFATTGVLSNIVVDISLFDDNINNKNLPISSFNVTIKANEADSGVTLTRPNGAEEFYKIRGEDTFIGYSDQNTSIRLGGRSLGILSLGYNQGESLTWTYNNASDLRDRVSKITLSNLLNYYTSGSRTIIDGIPSNIVDEGLTTGEEIVKTGIVVEDQTNFEIMHGDRVAKFDSYYVEIKEVSLYNYKNIQGTPLYYISTYTLLMKPCQIAFDKLGRTEYFAGFESQAFEGEDFYFLYGLWDKVYIPKMSVKNEATEKYNFESLDANSAIDKLISVIKDDLQWEIINFYYRLYGVE